MGLNLELRHSQNSTNPAKFNNEKIILSCPCYGDGYWTFVFFLETWVAIEFGSVKLKLVPATVCPPY